MKTTTEKLSFNCHFRLERGFLCPSIILDIDDPIILDIDDPKILDIGDPIILDIDDPIILDIDDPIIKSDFFPICFSNRGPVSQQMWHDKDPTSMAKGAEHKA